MVKLAESAPNMRFDWKKSRNSALTMAFRKSSCCVMCVKRVGQRVQRVNPCCKCWKCGWITPSFAWEWVVRSPLLASYQCRPGDIIGVKNTERSKRLAQQNLEYPGLANLPSHLEFDKNNLTGKVNGVIDREWVALQINELLVVEFYSRKA